jgi:molybdate transport system substrate-binding protein
MLAGLPKRLVFGDNQRKRPPEMATREKPVMHRRFAFSILAALAFAASPGSAADLKVFGAGAIEQPFHDLIAGFARDTGHKVEAQFGTVGGMQARLKNGEKADVIILSAPAMEELDKAGALVAGSRAEFGRATSGLGVRAGAAQPDISSPEAFKKTLVDAKSVAFTDPAAGGTTGIFFAGLIDRLGIADNVKKKGLPQPGGSGVAAAVADGKAEVGVTFISELLPNKGVKVVGPMPASIGLVVSYVGGISTNGQIEPARALIAYMTNEQSRAHYKAAGL